MPRKPRKKRTSSARSAAPQGDKAEASDRSDLGGLLEILPALIEGATAELESQQAEIDRLLALAKKRGMEVPEDLRQELAELKEVIRRGPPCRLVGSRQQGKGSPDGPATPQA